MSHRTQDLPPLTGWRHAVRELRHHEVARQGLGLLIVLVYALIAQPSSLTFYAAVPLVLAGLVVRLYASGYIVKNKSLATHGPYSIVRHPLYTGNILILAGFTLATGQAWPWAVSIAFLWFYYPTAIEYEDRKLHRNFGESWEAWSREVPALVPRTLRIRAGEGQWTLANSMKRNGEPVFAAWVVFWFVWIGRSVEVETPVVAGPPVHEADGS